MTNNESFIILPSKDLLRDKLWFKVFPRYSMIKSIEKNNTNWNIMFEDIHGLIDFYNEMKGPFRKVIVPIKYSKGIKKLIEFSKNKIGDIKGNDKMELVKLLTDHIDPDYFDMKYIPGNDSKYTEFEGVINYMCWQNLTDFIYMAIGTYFYYGDYKHFKRLKIYHAFFDIQMANNAYIMLNN